LGPAFVYGIWFIILSITVPLFISGIRKQKWIRVTISGIPIVFFGLMMFSIAYRTAMGATSPQWVYKQAFNRLPTNDVIIREYGYQFGTDFVSIYLKFEANSSTIEGLTKGLFVQIPKREFEVFLPGENYAPDWFRPLTSSPNLFYSIQPNSNKGLLSYNEESHIAYFHIINLF
jgi:hypothetical protein